MTTDAAYGQALKEWVAESGTVGGPMLKFIERRARELDAAKGGDANVEAVRAKLLARSRVGFAKYGVTTERADLTLADWLTHLQEELMDAAVYVEAAKRATPPAQAAEAVEYRMLDAKDFLEADDEFLDDDCVTWLRAGVHARLFLGQPYNPGFHKAARRAAIAAIQAGEG